MDWRWRKKRFETAFMRTVLTGGVGLYGMGIVAAFSGSRWDQDATMLMMLIGLILAALSVGCLTFLGFPQEKRDEETS